VEAGASQTGLTSRGLGISHIYFQGGPDNSGPTELSGRPKAARGLVYSGPITPAFLNRPRPLNLLRLWRSGNQVAGVTLEKTWRNGPGPVGTGEESKAAALSRKSTGLVLGTG